MIMLGKLRKLIIVMDQYRIFSTCHWLPS